MSCKFGYLGLWCGIAALFLLDGCAGSSLRVSLPVRSNVQIDLLMFVVWVETLCPVCSEVFNYAHLDYFRVLTFHRWTEGFQMLQLFLVICGCHTESTIRATLIILESLWHLRRTWFKNGITTLVVLTLYYLRLFRIEVLHLRLCCRLSFVEIEGLRMALVCNFAVHGRVLRLHVVNEASFLSMIKGLYMLLEDEHGIRFGGHRPVLLVLVSVVKLLLRGAPANWTGVAALLRLEVGIVWLSSLVESIPIKQHHSARKLFQFLSTSLVHSECINRKFFCSFTIRQVMLHRCLLITTLILLTGSFDSFFPRRLHNHSGTWVL